MERGDPRSISAMVVLLRTLALVLGADLSRVIEAVEALAQERTGIGVQHRVGVRRFGACDRKKEIKTTKEKQGG